MSTYKLNCIVAWKDVHEDRSHKQPQESIQKLIFTSTTHAEIDYPLSHWIDCDPMS